MKRLVAGFNNFIKRTRCALLFEICVAFFWCHFDNFELENAAKRNQNAAFVVSIDPLFDLRQIFVLLNK